MKQFIPIISITLFFSCSKFDGYIEERALSKSDSVKSYFLVNKSSDKKFTFTIKETSLINKTSSSYKTNFYTLEPGEEVSIGKNFTYSDLSYQDTFIVTSYDTLIDIVDYGQKIKHFDDSKNSLTEKFYEENGVVKREGYDYKNKYYINNKEVDEDLFWNEYSAENIRKAIKSEIDEEFYRNQYLADSAKLYRRSKQGKIETIIFIKPKGHISKIISPRIKTTYNYEISGQVLIKQ